VLAGVVGGAIRDPAQPCDRRDVDDGAGPRLEHHPAEGAAEQERPGQVHVEHPLPLLRGGLLGRRDERDPGVVDQDVGAPEPLPHLLRERRDVRLERDIARNVQHLPPAPSHDRRGFGGRLEIGQHHLVARHGEHLRRAAADAAGRSGDDGDFRIRCHRITTPRVTHGCITALYAARLTDEPRPGIRCAGSTDPPDASPDSA